MTLIPRPPVSASAGADYVGGLAQAWASLEPAQRRVDEAPDGPRPPDKLVQAFLQQEALAELSAGVGER
jgi:hypothetical protein